MVLGVKASRIISSFLSNHFQYVSIDTIKSEVTESLPCSIIQGSKLSALLYILYINEVTILHKLMNTDIYSKITSLQKKPNVFSNIYKSILN